MAKIIIKDEPLYNKYPSDFPIIQSFHKLIDLAVKKAQKEKSIYANIMSSADYTLHPDYYNDFEQENQFITVELYINDDDYISMSDNQESHTEAIGRIFSSIIPRTQQADLRYGICARSLGPVGDTDQWRANPFYRFRDEVEIVDQNTVEKIWTDGSALHVFISHKAEKKERAHNLKKKLLDFGISSFVAHDDIAPTEEWLTTIEKALFSSDALIALICENFKKSDWTDQEVGIAIGRQIPVFPVKLTETFNPYGFLGKIQAFKVRTDTVEEFLLRFAQDQRTASPTINSILSSFKLGMSAETIKTACTALEKAPITAWKISQKEVFSKLYTDHALHENSVATKIHTALGLDTKPAPAWESSDDEIPF